MSCRMLLLCLVVGGCAGRDLRPAPPITASNELCADHRLGPKDLCLPAARIERMLRSHALRVLQVRPPSSGTAGAKTVFLEFPDDHVRIKAKWKEAKRGGQGLNNEPRKEIAAYELQKLFLEPDEYVVPPAVGRCIPTDFYAGEVKASEAQPNLDDTRCVFGVLSYWLEGVKELDPLSQERFAADAAYRDRVATLNLMAYLMDHRDTRKSNFVVSKDAQDPRMFAVDNGLAFSGIRNPRAWFVRDWSAIVVPALPRRLVERLRTLDRADLDRLAVVAEFELRAGQLEPVPPTAPLAADEGVRRQGTVMQFGLTRGEIDAIAERLTKLIQRVDAHEIALFDDGAAAGHRRAGR